MIDSDQERHEGEREELWDLLDHSGYLVNQATNYKEKMPALGKNKKFLERVKELVKDN
jgi:hypothetical protein